MTCFRMLLLLSLFAVSAARAQSIGFSISDNSSSMGPDLTVTVVDDVTQAPLAGAKVSITDSLGFGKITDRIRSDASGTATFRGLSPLPKTVTVSDAGYATMSVVGVQGNQMTAFLRPMNAHSPTVVSSGTINMWDGVGDDSSIAHGGLVFRTVGVADLLQFEIGDFISPLKDSVDLGGILGKHNIPSNLVLPEQSVSYLFFNVDLNKPLYRLPIPTSQTVSLTGVEVEAKVSDIVSASTGHSFSYGFLNKIKFDRIGTSQRFSSDRDVQVNLDASMKLTAQHQVSISHSPPFTSDVVAVSFVDQNRDKSALIPNDLKTILDSQSGDGPQTVTLASPEGLPADSQAVATLAIGSKGTQISAILRSNPGRIIETGEFLNTDALAQNQAIPVSVTVHAPSHGVGAAIFTSDQPAWYVYTLPVAGSVQVPTQKIAASLALKSYTTNQMEFSEFDERAVDGTKIMSRLQRFARSSAKLGGRRR